MNRIQMSSDSFPSIRLQLQSFSASSPNGCSQEHLLQFWNDLGDRERAQRWEQVDAIDFEKIAALYAAPPVEDSRLQIIQSACAPAKLIPANVREESPEDFAKAETTGWQALREGRVGVVLVAGGEGSRLGFPHPKGQFPIGPVSEKSLYQLLEEQLVAISQRAQVKIPYYVMTSEATHAETKAFFEKHGYFGLDAERRFVLSTGENARPSTGRRARS